MPDTGTAESINYQGEFSFTFDLGPQVEESATCSGGFDHLFGGPMLHTSWITFSPNIGWKDSFMSFVNMVADCLSYKVVRDREARQTVIEK